MNKLKVHDIASFNTITNWDNFSKDCYAVIIRTGQNDWEDSKFRTHYASARSKAERIMLYHVVQPDGEPEVQIVALLSIYNSLGRKHRIFLDCEIIDYWTRDVPSVHVKHYPRNKDHYTYMMMTMLERIEKETGLIPGIYTNQSVWNTYVHPAGTVFYYNGVQYIAPNWKHYPLWIASYRFDQPALPTAWTSYVMWQDTAMACPGASGSIDQDWFIGTEDELDQFVGNEEIPVANPDVSGIKLSWPCDPVFKVGQKFGENPANYKPYGLAGHEGLDFLVPSGCSVLAMADGIVENVNTIKSSAYGINIHIVHHFGSLTVHTIYAHLQKALVSVGSQVKAGSIIALSDNTGNSSGPHLHVTVKVDGYKTPGYTDGILDPLPLLTQTIPVVTPTKFVVGVSGLRLRTEAGVSALSVASLISGISLKLIDEDEIYKDGHYWVPVKLYVSRGQNGKPLGTLK